jgi:putative DNA primase/helicase
MRQHVDLKALDGRWQDILPIAAGIDRALFTGKHVPCPLGCDGKRPFRFDNKAGSGSWICTHCGGGYPQSLVMRRLGCDYKTALEEIVKAAGIAPVTAAPRQREPDEERYRKARAALWKGSVPIEAGSVAGAYLDYRCDTGGSYPKALRAGFYAWEGVRYPALLALVTSADGKWAVQLQAVLLTPEGRKAPLEEAKLTTPGLFPMGGAVRLTPPAEEMGICEGVETALSCAKLFGIPTWAALDARHLEHWEPPPECKLLHIYGDRDGLPYCTGEVAAWTLFGRIARGRKVKVFEPHLPDETKTDWNDVHQRRRA